MGGSGRLLWAMAKRAGFSRADCLIVNTIGEWPGKADGNPTTEQLERYWDEFDTVVAASTARVVLCLGGAAFDRLTGIVTADKRIKRRTGIEAWRGYLVSPAECQPHTRRVVRYEQYKTTTKKHKKGDPKAVKHKVVGKAVLPSGCEWIIPTLHPAAVLRTGYKSLPAFAADVSRVGRASRGELRIPTCDWSEVPVVGTPSDMVAVDIETRREGNQDFIVRVGSSCARGTWTRSWDYLAKIGTENATNNNHTTAVLHNAQYDLPRLAAEGVQIREPIWDTMLGAVVLQPDLYKGLNSVASLVLDIPRWKHLSDEEPAKYNALDAFYTREIALFQKQEMERTGQLEWFTKGIMPALPVLIEMSKRGLKMDAERRVRWLEELTADEAEREARWRILTGGVHPNSPKQVQEYLYGTLGLPQQYGNTGGATSSVEALKDLLVYAAGRPEAERTKIGTVVQALLDYRGVAKLRTTYTEHPLGDDGCVHPSYLPASKDDENAEFGKGLAGTFRITTRDPNLQNQPPIARRLFVPHNRDLIFVEADYSQIELRIAAALSGDKALQEALLGDVHARTQELLHCDRVRAKNVMYGTLYGAGPRKLAKVLRAKGFALSEKEAQELQAALAQAYPALWEWRQHVINEAAKNYYLQTPFGARRYFWQGKRDAPAAIDFLPQGTAAGITWYIIPALDKALSGVGGLLQLLVHDSTLAGVARNRTEESVRIIKGEMEREWPQIAPGFRVPVEVKVGENWGEMTPWKS